MSITVADILALEPGQTVAVGIADTTAVRVPAFRNQTVTFTFDRAVQAGDDPDDPASWQIIGRSIDGSGLPAGVGGGELPVTLAFEGGYITSIT